MASDQTTPLLDLTRQRDLGDLLGDAFANWVAHLPVFLSLAFIVVAPFMGLINGLWAGTLGGASAGTPDLAPAMASVIANWLIIPPLITAGHVAAVLDLGAGRKPRLGGSLRVALRAFPVAFLVVALYGIAIALGAALLIVPGIWVSVALYFGAQAVVADRAGVLDALEHSREITRGQWWRTFGYLFLISILAAIIGGIAGLVLGGIVGLVTDVEVILAIAQIIAQTVTLSFTALAATLLFFDLRVRREWAVASERPLGVAPERPEPA